MYNINSKLMERYPGAVIAEGSQIAENCRVDERCEISAEAVLKHNVVVCSNVHIIGKVLLDRSVMIRENATLVGPLHIAESTIISHDSIIGATREEEMSINQETIIEKNCKIGKQVEINGGVNVGPYARIRSGSRVIGDVPQYGLASRSPAILERFACPDCGGALYPKRKMSEILVVQCGQCNQVELRFTISVLTNTPNHVLLPNRALGNRVSTDGDDQRWLDEFEMH